MLGNVQRLAAATGVGLLAVLAIVPIAAGSQESPKFKSGFRPALQRTPNPETVFEPIQPCRAIATGTSNGGGAIAADTTRSFYVSGTTGFDTQGGASGGCGVPSSATAVAISLTALATPGGGSGKVIAYPYGNTLPSTVALSFAPNIAQTSNVIVGVNQSRISLQAKVSSVQLNGDITGYFAPQIEVLINPDGSVFGSTSRILSVTHPSTGEYGITVDRDVLSCATQATAAIRGYVATAYGDQNSTLHVYTDKLQNGAFVPVDTYVSLSAHC